MEDMKTPNFGSVIDHDRADDDELRKVFTKAKERNYSVADTNPCFELWLLLHHDSLDKFKRLEASGDTAKCSPSSKALELIDSLHTNPTERENGTHHLIWTRLKLQLRMRRE